MAIDLTANEIEASNRAEATALLIRAGFRVYPVSYTHLDVYKRQRRMRNTSMASRKNMCRNTPVCMVKGGSGKGLSRMRGSFVSPAWFSTIATLSAT